MSVIDALAVKQEKVYTSEIRKGDVLIIDGKLRTVLEIVKGGDSGPTMIRSGGLSYMHHCTVDDSVRVLFLEPERYEPAEPDDDDDADEYGDDRISPSTGVSSHYTDIYILGWDAKLTRVLPFQDETPSGKETGR